MTITLSILAAITVAWILAYHRANGVAWTIALAAAAVVVELRTAIPAAAITAIWIAIALFGLFSIVKPLRRAVVTGPIFGLYKRILPQISQTEQEALDAGSIWWDADLFTGKPDQYRWLNGGGSKWGIDDNKAARPDFHIDRWRVISAEEVSQEILQALITKDFARLERLLISDAEVKALELADRKSVV